MNIKWKYSCEIWKCAANGRNEIAIPIPILINGLAIAGMNSARISAKTTANTMIRSTTKKSIHLPPFFNIKLCVNTSAEMNTDTYITEQL